MSGHLEWPPCPLWDAVLPLYDRPGVAAACIALQDRRGVDVDLLLLALWLAGRGVALDAARARALHRLTRRWQRRVVGPVRAARRALAAEVEAARPGEVAARFPSLATTLRRRLGAVELELERLELLALFDLVQDWQPAAPPGPALAGDNWRALFRLAAADGAELAHLLRAAWPEAPAATIARGLSRASGG